MIINNLFYGFNVKTCTKPPCYNGTFKFYKDSYALVYRDRAENEFFLYQPSVLLIYKTFDKADIMQGLIQTKPRYRKIRDCVSIQYYTDLWFDTDQLKLAYKQFWNTVHV